jgi:PAS domain S-box-containing protein
MVYLFQKVTKITNPNDVNQGHESYTTDICIFPSYIQHMENAALLKAIIENAIDGIITIDDRGKMESINPAGCKLFGYQPEEVIGKNIAILMPTPDKERHDGYLSRYQETGHASIIGTGREVIGLRKGGSTFPFRLGISEVQFSGRKIYTGFIHDLRTAAGICLTPGGTSSYQDPIIK